MNNVPKCNRKNCDSLLCDRHSNVYGYICKECFEDLEEQPFVDLVEFMSTNTRNENMIKIWKDQINRIFKIIE